MISQTEIEKIIQFKIKDIKDDETLLQLGLDSIKLVELAGYIEQNTDLKIYEDLIYEMNGKWIKNFINKYEKKIDKN
jgi:acyl carrier protein